jgi:DivIVA domain-containing protein
MIWFFVIVVVLAMGGIALVASGRGAPMLDEHDDRPDALVPTDGVLGPQDLRRVRFSLAFRGYRMSEVDTLLSRLAAEMEADRAWRSTDEAVEQPDVQPSTATWTQQSAPEDDTPHG